VIFFKDSGKKQPLKVEILQPYNFNNSDFEIYTMDVNVGRTDQFIRIAGGFVLVGLAVNSVLDSCVPEIYAPIFGVIGGVFLGTGLFRRCPVCHVAGTDTIEEDED
jgi:hypothetical protein